MPPENALIPAPLALDEVEALRADFPVLQLDRTPGRRLIYLDNAATSQKPSQVVDAVARFYSAQNANIRRGVYQLSELATDLYESARQKVQRFLGAASHREIVFTRGTTESINLVAQTYGRRYVQAGDEILVSTLEHHSNLVPWQMLCEEKGARLRVIPITDDGDLQLDDLEQILTNRTRIVALTQVSNAIGTVNPVDRVIEAAHAVGARVLIDGAQSVPHMPVNVQALDCDFFACSGHKMLGPTGVGVLYGRADFLDAMPPWQGGGEMVLSVSFEKVVYNAIPMKFEAGTPPIAAAVGLGAAIDYLERIGMNRIAAYEHQLLAYGTAILKNIPGLRLLGNAREKAPILSFVMDCAHAHDVAQILDDAGIAIRAGHHCAQPLMERLGVPATARASPAFYNTPRELDALGDALRTVNEVFG